MNEDFAKISKAAVVLAALSSPYWANKTPETQKIAKYMIRLARGYDKVRKTKIANDQEVKKLGSKPPLGESVNSTRKSLPNRRASSPWLSPKEREARRIAAVKSEIEHKRKKRKERHNARVDKVHHWIKMISRGFGDVHNTAPKNNKWRFVKEMVESRKPNIKAKKIQKSNRVVNKHHDLLRKRIKKTIHALTSSVVLGMGSHHLPHALHDFYDTVTAGMKAAHVTKENRQHQRDRFLNPEKWIRKRRQRRGQHHPDEAPERPEPPEPQNRILGRVVGHTVTHETDDEGHTHTTHTFHITHEEFRQKIKGIILREGYEKRGSKSPPIMPRYGQFYTKWDKRMMHNKMATYKSNPEIVSYYKERLARKSGRPKRKIEEGKK